MSYQPEESRPRPTAREVWERQAVRWFRREFDLELSGLPGPDRRVILARLGDLWAAGEPLQHALRDLEPFVVSFLDRAARRRALDRVRQLRELRRRRTGPSGA